MYSELYIFTTKSLSLKFLNFQVNIIVMLTALEEDNNKKADQYWPDRNTKVINVGKEIKLEYVETTYQGTYLNRSVIFVYLFTLINIFQDYPNNPGRRYHQEGDPPAD